MGNYWKQFGVWVIALKHKITVDIFASTRFKITILYFTMGVVILAIIGSLAYTNNVRLGTIDFAVGFSVLIVIVGVAYILAGITLQPIKQAMEKQWRFIANVSHELRTPLSIMKTNSEVTLRNVEKLSSQDLIEAIDSNLEEIDRLAAITQFLLDFSGMENRLRSLKLTRVDLGAVTRKVVVLMEKTAAEKGVALNFSSDTPAIIKGNEVALEEMILNLLKNAVNYTPAGKSVRVTLSGKSYGRYSLAIHDMGIGIAEKDLPKIFEPFYRASNRINKDHIGMGLAIVKEIANLHRATLSVSSTLGHGTTVVVKFPAFPV